MAQAQAQADAQAQGTIVQCIGAVIDIEFPRERMPRIYDALVLQDSGDIGLAEKGLTFEVEQQLGDRPRIDKLVGPIKVQLDAYRDGKIDELFILTTRFINTMKQEPMAVQLLPLHFAQGPAGNIVDTAMSDAHSWDYIYEPDAKEVLDGLLLRYIEALVLQAVVENTASEQSARMVAMKAASDNAADIIEELTLVLNKTRQASITKELAEIVGGAAAV